MEFERLLRALSSPGAYPHPCDRVEVCHTHISAVFLAGSYAYKIKKPLDLGFLDFSTLEKRRHFCHEEVRVNRRLAPRVYLGVVPVTVHRGRVQVDGEGEVVEWAVWMRRLPEDATLLRRLGRGEVTPPELDGLARRIAGFHREAERGPHVSRFGRWEVVARNARENFEQTRGHRGRAVDPGVWDRVRELTERALAGLEPLVEDRAARGLPCDTHGDLHLEHVYRFPDRPEPEDWVVVDAIEFNERFRYADPVADAAFLAMDLAFRGRRDLAGRFARAYLEAAADPEGGELLPFYTAYRAVVRAKVEGLAAAEPEIPPEQRRRALDSARAHWLLALGELEAPARRPALVAVGGLPGTGKSTLARALAGSLGFQVIDSDRVRKELAGLNPEAPAPAPYGQGIYTPGWTEATYREMLRRAGGILSRGGRVLLDATFREDRWRRAVVETATRHGVRAVILVCEAPEAAVRQRLAGPREGPSDAGWAVYLEAARRWEPAGPETAPWCRAVHTGGTPDQALAAARRHLEEAGLA